MYSSLMNKMHCTKKLTLKILSLSPGALQIAKSLRDKLRRSRNFSRKTLLDNTEDSKNFQLAMSRHLFTSSIDPNLEYLEIGPLHNPQLEGGNIKYFDLMNSENLKLKAKEHGLSTLRVPHIDYFDENGDLSIIQREFDGVFSSHVIEHQPNLIKHLRQVANLLKNTDSSYFLIIPDHRYCFDHFLHPSNLSEVVGAFEDDVKKPPKHKVIEHWALTAHNDPNRHWVGDHGEQFTDLASRWAKALNSYQEKEYNDAHCWQFTPESFSQICNALYELEYIDLKLVKTWDTNFGDIEFFAQLKLSRSK